MSYKSETEKIHQFKVKFDYIFYCRPEEADISRYVIEVGDIVVVATDGLFDNLSDDHILEITSDLKVR